MTDPLRRKRGEATTATKVEFTRLSNASHRVTVRRANGTHDSVELDSKDFLRHDLAHFAVEAEVGLDSGVWGCVADGGRLDGDGLDGDDMALAERLAGPVQSLMRTGADVATIRTTIDRTAPDLIAADTVTADLADRLHRRLRQLNGHWAATGFDQTMTLQWPPDPLPPRT